MAQRMPKGVRKIRSDWANPVLNKPKKRIQPTVVTPEQKASWDKKVEELTAHWNRPFEPGERGYVGPADVTPQQRAQTKIKDRDARIAVEDDTDSNHDNLEPARPLLGDEDLDRNRVLLANCIMNCGTRIYEGNNHTVTAADEFYCPRCAILEGIE